MKRYGIYLIPLLIVIFNMTLIPSTGSSLSVVNSKHDLSSGSTASIKAASSGNTTTEICVFCHTPHHSRTDAPLWNRSFSGATYETYTSDVLAAMGYPGAENPNVGAVHVKTRICLSCHDGMIALGSLVNAPYGLSGDIDMTGPLGALVDGKLQPQTQGYIGVDLRDDHPVAIPHISGSAPGQDPELKNPVSGNVRLYYLDGSVVKFTTSAGTDKYVECTSCHNPHNNEWGNFLLQSNSGSAICLNCHNKTGFETDGIPSTTSAHLISTDGYAPSGGTLGSTVGAVKCMDCHFSHKASGTTTGVTLPNLIPADLTANPKAGYYLLTYQQEQSCYNNKDRWGTYANVTVCHGNFSTIKKIQDLVEYSNAHKVGSYSSEHEATEGQSAGWFTSSNWHVECTDCHNAHTAGKQSHNSPLSSAFTITAISPLYGTGGVNVNFPASNWSAPGSGDYTYQKPIGVTDITSVGANMEYKICFKCHSLYAWNLSSPPTSPAISANMTDQAKEFNNANNSFHPIVDVTGHTEGTLVTPWNSNQGNQKMFCSDCHTKNGGGTPKGPHGSTSNKAILFANFDDTYSTTKSASQLSSDLCFTCHQQSVYLNGSEVPGSAVTGFMTSATGTNLHTRHANVATSATSSFAYRCVNCHSRIPHGYERRAMIVVSGDTDESTYAANDVYGYARISSFSFSGAQAYSSSSCLTIAGCH